MDRAELIEKQARVLAEALLDTTDMLRKSVPSQTRPREMQDQLAANDAMLAMMGMLP